jgi:exodeoxyribonuclease V alpha subunit
MIRGIGPDHAMRMARQFGKEVFDIIEANPERLREVEGTGPIMSWNPHRLARDIRGIGFRTADVIAENLESIS